MKKKQQKNTEGISFILTKKHESDWTTRNIESSSKGSEMQTIVVVDMTIDKIPHKFDADMWNCKRPLGTRR